MSVIVRLAGGLGNQMFQYAAGKSIARSWRGEVLLDTRSYAKDNLRSFELHRWRVSGTVASGWQLSRYPEPILKLYRLLDRWGIGGSHFYIERSLTFDPGLRLRKPPLYLEGYFQSARYFQDVRDELMSEFVPSRALSDENRHILRMINDSESISIHVRRADYVADPANLRKHGVCGETYYQAAAERILQICHRPSWFVFSDDMEWAREHVRLPGQMVHVSHNASEPEMDMHLMANCQHNICANSSFSWWGAWLNANTNKTVIAPAAWFASRDLSSEDLVPVEWVRI